ncbi:MAG: hypothetical protein AAGH40_01115 [Verrucomicrobiota bacterium]
MGRCFAPQTEQAQADCVEDVKIPNEIDWRSEPWDLDIPYAYKHFFGKSIEEGEKLFEENSLYYQEDMMFMPLSCFNFYIHSYISYLLSERSRGDSDGASAFFGLFDARKKDFLSSQEVRGRTAELMEHMRTRQQYYDASIKIYGRFSKKADKVLSELKN